MTDVSGLIDCCWTWRVKTFYLVHIKTFWVKAKDSIEIHCTLNLHSSHTTSCNICYCMIAQSVQWQHCRLDRGFDCRQEQGTFLLLVKKPTPGLRPTHPPWCSFLGTGSWLLEFFVLRFRMNGTMSPTLYKGTTLLFMKAKWNCCWWFSLMI